MRALALVLAACGTHAAVQPDVPDASGVSDASGASGDAAPDDRVVLATDVSVWETPLAQSQMDCFWDAGVRHVIVGTQDALVAQQQLAMAVARGMTVDAYVYLYWDRDAAAQVTDAFAMVQASPIGRMWLDIEQDPAGLDAAALIARIQQALAACEAHAGVTCGIYTGPGWWKSYVANTDAFAQVPLWYALYNGKQSLDDWPAEQFGGWPLPTGKQFQTAPWCGTGGADWDTIHVTAAPTVVVDRSPPVDTHAPPIAPDQLWPDAIALPLGYAKIMSGTVPLATQYQLALEVANGSTWTPYYTWTNADAYVKVSPPAMPATYRFRVRAFNTYGWGAWSSYATFRYGM